MLEEEWRKAVKPGAFLFVNKLNTRTADSGARGCVPPALHTLFLNTLNELIFCWL